MRVLKRMIVVTCLATVGCQATSTRKVALPPPPAPLTGIVFCADGAGGYGYTTEALKTTLAEMGMSLNVVLVPWSHGRGRMLADHCHWAHTHHQGHLLAEAIQITRLQYPTLPIFIIGHSAGCAVVLEAAHELAANSVERIILLAPSVSSHYDLRAPLASARHGIEAFVSEWDIFALGVGMRLFGTTDRKWSFTAGRVGFCPPDDCPDTQMLYARLHQHFWDFRDWDTGHHGGHYGSYEPEFLRQRVIPLMRR